MNFFVSLNLAFTQVFPFRSERKRMGIIIQDLQSYEIIFYVKGADAVMTSIVQYNDWLDEEVNSSLWAANQNVFISFISLRQVVQS